MSALLASAHVHTRADGVGWVSGDGVKGGSGRWAVGGGVVLFSNLTDFNSTRVSI